MNIFQRFRNWNIIQKKHCEKTSYVLALSLIASVYFGYMVVTGKMNYPIEYLYLSIAGLVGGYAGVLNYKVMHEKPLTPRTVIFFWKDK